VNGVAVEEVAPLSGGDGGGPVVERAFLSYD
jgi:hypothetical protein